MEKDIATMLIDLCCSRCKNDFEQNDVTFIHKEGAYNVINITCSKCGKDFGTIYLKLTDNTSDNVADIILKDTRDKPPINSDDVIDAHEYIKDIEKNLEKFLNED